MSYLGRKGSPAPLVSSDIPDNAITSAKIVAETIDTSDIADNAITSSKIGVDVIVAEDIAANAVTVAEIQDDAVTGAKLAEDIEISTTGTITSTAGSNNKISSGGWVNGDNSGAVPYDTLTESGTNLSSVISDGSAVAYAKTNYLDLEVGKIYRLRVNITAHTSGQNPQFSIGGTTSASKYVAQQAIPSSGYSGKGIVDIIFECIDSDMAGTNADSARVWMYNNEATNFVVETSVTEDFLQK